MSLRFAFLVGTLLLSGLSAQAAPEETGPFRITKDWKIVFKDDGTLKIFRRGWFKNEEHPVYAVDGDCYVYLAPAPLRIIDIGSQPSPSDRYTAHLEPHGKVSCWRITEDGATEVHPAKVVKGEWQYYAQGEWLPLFYDDF
jgi:hypothetical protein